MSTQTKFISVKQLCELTSLSRTTIWRLCQTDTDFPKPFHITPHRIVWREHEVQEWMESICEKEAS